MSLIRIHLASDLAQWLNHRVDVMSAHRSTKCKEDSRMHRWGFIAILVVPVVWFLWLGSLSARQGDAVRIDADDIGGVVASSNGPEAGVWVIAETRDQPTPLRKIVVTDDRGRYVVPDLPKGNYLLWVRGYGLVDSPKVQAVPGKIVNLTAIIAPTPQAAAQYYPANYWLSLIELPKASEFPGTGSSGNGIGPTMKTQADFVGLLAQNGCASCHQMGSKITREMPKGGGPFANWSDAWDKRVKFGQSGSFMSNELDQLGRPRALRMLSDWSERIAKGAVPPAPPRPSGLERNVVITEWDWGNGKQFVHDTIASDETNPTVNANGPVYGATEFSDDVILALDPLKNTVTSLPVPMQDYDSPRQWSREALLPSPYWGEEVFWNSKTAPHNPVFDKKGRLWVTSTVSRPDKQPAWCSDGSIPSSKIRPLASSGKHLSVYDPKTKEFTPIRTCFGTHHIAIDYSPQQRVWVDSGGYLDIGKWEKTHDEKTSQGWVVFVADANGNGKRDDFVGVNDPLDPSKDKLIPGGGYDLATAPDGSIWFVASGTPGRIVRLAPGSTPELDGLAEIYEVPPPAHSTRGIEVDRNGVAWVALGSGHLASLDRRKCKILNGPNALSGRHCPEGWSLYPDPSPRYTGTDMGADAHYLTWVDKFNTFGLDDNVPFEIGSNSDSLIAMASPGKWVVLRVPYPMGYFPKGMDGRIDDPKGGWKGHGAWSTYAGQPMWHQETGKGSTGHVLKFQLRPDPLAR
jgi:hypothetical protein